MMNWESNRVPPYPAKSPPRQADIEKMEIAKRLCAKKALLYCSSNRLFCQKTSFSGPHRALRCLIDLLVCRSVCHNFSCFIPILFLEHLFEF